MITMITHALGVVPERGMHAPSNRLNFSLSLLNNSIWVKLLLLYGLNLFARTRVRFLLGLLVRYVLLQLRNIVTELHHTSMLLRVSFRSLLYNIIIFVRNQRSLNGAIKRIEWGVWLWILLAIAAQVIDDTTCWNWSGIFIISLNIFDYVFLAIFNFDILILILVIMVHTFEIGTFTFVVLKIIFTCGLHCEERLLATNEKLIFLRLQILTYYRVPPVVHKSLACRIL